MLPGMTDELRSGGCLCGAVRFEITLPSKWCAHCHCSLCRRAHGAAWVTWFGVASDRFRITAGADTLRTYASSAAGRRTFCSVCGSTMLFEEQERWPDEVHVVLACLHGELDRAPTSNVYWDERVPWGQGHEHLAKRGGPTGNERLE